MTHPLTDLLAGVSRYNRIGQQMEQSPDGRWLHRLEVLAALSAAPVGVRDAGWKCVVCGRVVDTREKDEGGDGHGCEYAEGWTCSSECAEKLHPDPDWMKAALTPAPADDVRRAALMEAAALVRAEFRLSEQDVAEGTSWTVNIGDFVADRILALIEKDTK